MTGHDFTKGAELNENGLDKLRERYARQRMNAEGLLSKLQADRLNHVDIVADTRALAMVPVPEETAAEAPQVDQIEREENLAPKVVVLPRGDEDWYKITGPIIPNSHAHGQIASHLKIPMAYYRRMLADAPDLLSNNVNRWFEEAGNRRMLRLLHTYRGVLDTPQCYSTGRAYLSDRYRRLDLADLAESFVPMLTDEAEGWQITQCGLTSLRMHIEAIMPTLNAEVRVGDEVALAVKITSSDVGAGALQVALGVHRVVCSNLAIVPSYTQRQIHLGRSQDDFVELLSDSTLKKEDELIIAKMRDIVASMANAEHFKELVSVLQDSARAVLPNPVAATEMFGNIAGLKQQELQLVQNTMITNGDATVWGLTNALTQSAQLLDYERKHELETFAGKMMESPKDWRQLVQAA